jgi:hypothetical protein
VAWAIQRVYAARGTTNPQRFTQGWRRSIRYRANVSADASEGWNTVDTVVV